MYVLAVRIYGIIKANGMIDSYPTTRKHLKDEEMIIENFDLLIASSPNTLVSPRYCFQIVSCLLYSK